MEQKKYVGFWKRFVAYLFDLIFVSLPYYSIIGLFKLDINSSIYQLMSLIVNALYFIFFWATQDGQTVGNRILKIKVIKEDGTAMNLSSAILRYVGFIFSSVILCIGFIWVGFDKKKQGLHDKLAKTVVIETGKPKTILVVISLIVGLISFSLIVASFAIGQYNKIKNSGVNTSFVGDPSKLANEVFANANTYRRDNGLNEFVADSRLCAYAQRRLEQVNTLGKMDDGKGFYEDTSNVEMNNAYFIDNPNVSELHLTLPAYVDAIEIVDSWWNYENSSIKNKAYTNGCVRSDSNFIFFIMGGK